MNALDMIPWEQSPEIKALEPVEITWKNGRFLIPRNGYLTANELQSLREIDSENEMYRCTLDAAVKIHDQMCQSNEVDIPTRYQIYLILNGISIENLGAHDIDFAIDPVKQKVDQYKDDVQLFIKKIKEINNRIIIRSATVMMRRIIASWGDNETIELPEAIRNKLYAVYQSEDFDGRDTDEESQRKAIEEDLKKLREARRSIATELTMQISTGNAQDYGPEGKNLAVKTLATSQADTSSKPLKKAIDLKKNDSIDKN